MKITIHPLFVLAGLFSAVFGGLPVFAIYTLTALAHECGHIFCARSMGFYCRRVKLMPYGAAAVCELEGISAADEVKLALAGPLVNASICVFLGGLWWFYPVTYAYTDILMQANAVMLAVNILPAYPLDGGRVARCALSKLFSERVAEIIIRCISAAVAASFVALYFIADWGISPLIFAAFLLCSVFEKTPDACRINFATSERKRRGLEIKYIMADEELTYRRAIKFLDEKKYVVLVCGNRRLTQDELYEKFAECNIYDKVFVKEEWAAENEQNKSSDVSGCLKETFEVEKEHDEEQEILKYDKLNS